MFGPAEEGGPVEVSIRGKRDVDDAFLRIVIGRNGGEGGAAGRQLENSAGVDAEQITGGVDAIDLRGEETGGKRNQGVDGRSPMGDFK